MTSKSHSSNFPSHFIVIFIVLYNIFITLVELMTEEMKLLPEGKR